MAGERSTAGTGGAPLAPARPGYWFPLVLFGGLAALSLPLSALMSPRLPERVWLFRVVYPNVAEVLYLGGGSVGPPFPFPLGWYWASTLVAGVLVSAAWYRWHDRRTGGRTPLRGFLVTGLVLAVVCAALPLTALSMSTLTAYPLSPAWQWLDVLWRLGVFALLAIAAGLGLLAWNARSRALALITAVYVLSVSVAGWHDLLHAGLGPFFSPFEDPSVLLPAAVLVFAGAGVLAAGAVRRWRAGTS